VAVAIVTAAPHRAEAYAANRFVIEAITDRLPIWKRERFTDGTEWKRAGA
jgi:molybdopterin synthase catalytic subunit